MKTVIDCNVIISAGITDGNCRKIIAKIITNHTNFISEPILLEYKNVISRPKFKPYKQLLISLIKLICENSSYIDIENYKMTYSLPDIDDEIYLKTALKSKSDYIITGNLKDFPNTTYQNTKIVSPNYLLGYDI